MSSPSEEGKYDVQTGVPSRSVFHFALSIGIIAAEAPAEAAGGGDGAGGAYNL